MNYGTYTTIDCPTKNEDKAYVWLQTEFEKIGGVVKRKLNPHDFGTYASFEVDYPEKLELVDDDPFLEEGEELSEEDEALIKEKEEWTNKANILQEKYSKKFGKYL